MAELTDFSSFDPVEEKSFVPFERAMRDNEKRAFTIGFGIAGGVFLIAALIVLTLYTPCTAYCERPPSTCTKDSEISAFKSNCESSCSALEHESNLPIVRSLKDETTGKVEEHKEMVSGSEFVRYLAGCSFSGGSGETCEGVTQIAEAKGLWCAKK